MQIFRVIQRASSGTQINVPIEKQNENKKNRDIHKDKTRRTWNGSLMVPEISRAPFPAEVQRGLSDLITSERELWALTDGGGGGGSCRRRISEWRWVSWRTHGHTWREWGFGWDVGPLSLSSRLFNNQVPLGWALKMLPVDPCFSILCYFRDWRLVTIVSR